MIGITALVLAGFMALDDCEGCTDKVICKPHKEADAQVLKSLKSVLRSKEEGERLAAYKAVAEAQRAHANAPSKTLSKTLAKGAVDDAVPVRTESLKALTEVGDPELAVSTAVDAVTELPTFLSSLGFGGRGSWRGAGGAGQPDEAREKLAAARSYGQQLIASLASLPDDRCVKALVATMKGLDRRLEREFAGPIAQALLDLRARKGVEAVVEKFVAQVRAGTDTGGGGRRGGGAGAGGAGAGGGRGGRGGFGGDGGKALHELLIRLCVDLEIDSPEWSDDEPADWEAWFRANQKTFPAKLGKISLASRNAHAE